MEITLLTRLTFHPLVMHGLRCQSCMSRFQWSVFGVPLVHLTAPEELGNTPAFSILTPAISQVAYSKVNRTCDNLRREILAHKCPYHDYHIDDHRKPNIVAGCSEYLQRS
jgi:hypothetical protein